MSTARKPKGAALALAGRMAGRFHREALLQQKSAAARKAVRETFRSFSRLSGVDSNAAGLMTSAWASLMDGSFEGDGR